MEFLPKKIQERFKDAYEIAVATPRVAGAKVSAILLHKNRIAGVGVNSMRTNPFRDYVNDKFYLYCHAEVAAIKNALRTYRTEDLAKMVMIVCRAKIFKVNDIEIVGTGLAKPCVNCQKVLAEFGIRRVYYSVDSINQEFSLL